jgi:hypothetical protein
MQFLTEHTLLPIICQTGLLCRQWTSIVRGMDRLTSCIAETASQSPRRPSESITMRSRASLAAGSENKGGSL